MAAYYNEFDPNAAAWLRRLIKDGRIASGEVDERSITDVKAEDIRSFTQVHFFAGIGGWSYALRLAGWEDSAAVWTGSCPCQPFSTAGKHQGAADSRHLWPHMLRLIAECKPTTVFGEQVASKDGRKWLSGVRTDLEALDYGVGAADLCAAGIGAPHIRQRLWWVADASSWHTKNGDLQRGGEYGLQPASNGVTCRLVDSEAPERWGAIGTSDGRRRSAEVGRPSYADTWGDVALVACRDGKVRRIKSGIEPLAHGLPGRLELLRGYGNAIVPQLAAEFVRAYRDVVTDDGCATEI